MANLCYSSVVITGDETALGDLRQKIVDQDKDLLDKVWILGLAQARKSDYGIVTDLDSIAEGKGDTPICFSVGSKWSAPQNELDDLAKLYPTLTIEVDYEEPGNGVFGKLVYKDGEIQRDITMDGDSFYQENSEDYAGLVKDIKTRKYKEFFREYITEHNPETDDWMQYGPYAEKHVLARVKDRDLPKLMGHNWITSECDEEYRNRLEKMHG